MHNSNNLQYLKVQVETASPGELTLMLYQEMVKSLLRAKHHYALHQMEDVNSQVHKVRTILSELMVTLNMDYEISKQLYNLYSFYQAHLATFIIKREESILEDTLQFCREMAETWKEALLRLKLNEVKAHV